MSPPPFSPAELAEFQAYWGPHYTWIPIGEALDVIVACAIIAASPAIYSWVKCVAERVAQSSRARSKVLDKLWGGPGWGAALLFVAAYLVLLNLEAFPSSFYFGYLHEKAFGLTHYTLWTWTEDFLRARAVALTLWTVLAVALFGLARRTPRWWLPLALVSGLGMWASEALDPYRARFYHEQQSLPAGSLRDAISRMLDRVQVPFTDILVEKASRTTGKVDVYCAGGGANLKVILGDALVRDFTQDEVVAAVAHEAGHVKKGSSVWPRVGSFLCLGALLYGFERLLRTAAKRRWLGAAEPGDIRLFPVIVLAFHLFMAVATPISAAFSREREREADAFAIETTGNPQAFRDLLVRAARVNKADPSPPRWVVWLTQGHPPMGERIAWAEYVKNAAGK